MRRQQLQTSSDRVVCIDRGTAPPNTMLERGRSVSQLVAQINDPGRLRAKYGLCGRPPNMDKTAKNWPMIRVGLVILIYLVTSGCAIYYRDASSGAEHIWGFGHLATRVTHPEYGKQAIITKAELAGIAFSVDNGFSISAGWDCRERITVYDENTSIAIGRNPRNDFLLFEIGSGQTEMTPSSETNTVRQEEDTL